MLVLGIETSCDETAVALVEDGRRIRASVVADQLALHARFGGVVPEVASRQHVLALVPVIETCLVRAGARLTDVDLVAVTHEPGLVGSLLAGVATAKGLALGAARPLLGVHHLEGHLYANWLEPSGAPEPRFPVLGLIVSGGHSELALIHEHGQYRSIGSTRDDAAGEAFDKAARLLGLGFPGGPALEAAARHGDPGAFAVPRAWLGDSWDFSFSGMKTALRRLVEAHAPAAGPLPPALVHDLAASFQAAMIDVLVTKTLRAAEVHGAAEILLAGGVAANRALLARFEAAAPVPVRCPPPGLCTDNGAMIAAAGYYRARGGARSGLDLDVRAVAQLGGPRPAAV